MSEVLATLQNEVLPLVPAIFLKCVFIITLSVGDMRLTGYSYDAVVKPEKFETYLALLLCD